MDDSVREERIVRLVKGRSVERPLADSRRLRAPVLVRVDREGVAAFPVVRLLGRALLVEERSGALRQSVTDGCD